MIYIGYSKAKKGLRQPKQPQGFKEAAPRERPGTDTKLCVWLDKGTRLAELRQGTVYTVYSAF